MLNSNTQKILDLIPRSISEISNISEIENLNTNLKRKIFYKIELKNGQILHLTYGKKLAKTYELSVIINQLMPAITCKPIFIVNKGEYQLFGQEFFDGKPIDICLDNGIISIDQSSSVIRQIIKTLKGLESESSEKELLTELESFKQSILSNQLFDDLDINILNSYIFPTLKEILLRLKPNKRWTPGDLAARNILVNKDNQFRLIDFEFAQITHFHLEDWVRLKTFSTKTLQNLDPVKEIYKAQNKSAHLIFHLRQIYLNRLVFDEKKYLDYFEFDLIEVFEYMFHNKISNSQKSIILESFLRQKNNSNIKHKNLLLEHEELSINKEIIETQLFKFKDKVDRIQSSFSWKITSPLRYLRRVFFDRKTNFSGSNISYKKWIIKNDKIRKGILRKEYKDFANLNFMPLVSIVMPVYNTPKKFLELAIESVLNQIYENFELCISDDNSSLEHVFAVLEKYKKQDKRVKVIYRKNRGNISNATKTALEICEGKYVGFLDHDDILRENALFEIVKCFCHNKETKLIYSDEDKIDENGNRSSPYFKPSWNRNLLLSQNYLCHFVTVRKDILDCYGKFREECDGAQDWDNLLHITEKLEDEEIHHIPKILYHWRIHDESTAKSISVKSNVVVSSKKALTDYCKRNKIDATVDVVQEHYISLNLNLPQKKPLVTVVIPTKNNYHKLKRCVDSFTSLTNYQNYSLLIIDNGSDHLDSLNYLDIISKQHKVIRYTKPFNHSAINNFAVTNYQSDLYLFLNDDTEVIENQWLTEMVQCSMFNEVGVIGCKLLYPSRRVQHAGVIVGIGDFAGHAFKHLEANSDTMGCRLNLKQNYSAVTAACMLVKQNIFKSVGGFNEKDLPTSYNDVDLCLRIGEAGFKVLYTPCTLIHHESATRGYPTTLEEKFTEEKAVKFMRKNWEKYFENDPNYNPNLTKIKEDFSLAL